MPGRRRSGAAAAVGTDDIAQRTLWEMEHRPGMTDRRRLWPWIRRQFALSPDDAQVAAEMMTRFQAAGAKLEQSGGPVPRGEQERQQYLSAAYRVRVYAVLRRTGDNASRYIPFEEEFDRNPTAAAVAEAVDRWWAANNVRIRTVRYPTAEGTWELVGHTIRSLECRTR